MPNEFGKMRTLRDSIPDGQFGPHHAHFPNTVHHHHHHHKTSITPFTKYSSANQ